MNNWNRLFHKESTTKGTKNTKQIEQETARTGKNREKE